MNILEGLFQSGTEPKTAPHVGEVFFLWTYYTALVNSRALCLILLNHTADKEIRQLMEHFLDEVEEPQIKQVAEVMRTEGIPFPVAVADHPKANETQIPLGAKFTDAEVINLVVAKIEGMLAICNIAMAQTVRDDLGLLFYRFQGQLVTQAFPIKKTMQKRGWLLVPPPYVGHAAAHRPTP